MSFGTTGVELMDIWNEERFVEDISNDQLERLLNELIKKDRIAVHVESLAETFPVEDVYDNTSVLGGDLTILLVSTVPYENT